jgi:hypothetical protein
LIWPVTRRSCSRAERHGRHHVAEAARGGGDARHGRLNVGVKQVADQHHRVVALLQRLRVEERRQARQRLAVVVDGDRRVLLKGGELVGDLLVEPGDEGVGGHARTLSSRCRRTVRRP